MATMDTRNVRPPGRYGLGSVWVSIFSTLLCLAVLWPRLLLVSFGQSNQNPLTLLTLGMLVASAILAVSNSAIAHHYLARAGYLAIVLAIFVLLILCKYYSAFEGQDPARSVNILNNSLVYTMSFFPIGLVMFVDSENERRFTSVVLLSAVVVSLLAGYEILQQNSLTMQFRWLFNNGTIQSFAGENLLNNVYRGGMLRAKATFSHPLVFGQFVAACMPLALSTEGKNHGWTLAKRIVIIVILAVGLFSSSTRSAIFCGVFSVGAYLALGMVSSRNRFIVFEFLFMCIAAIGLFSIFGDSLGGLIQGRTAEEASSSEVRSLMFERAFFALSSSPIFGFGEGMSALIAGVISSTGVLTIDSLYISYLVDNGYIGGALYFALVASVLVLGLRGLRRLDDPGRVRRLRSVIAMTLALLFGQAVLSIADNLVFVYLGLAYIVAVSLGGANRPGRPKSAS